MELMTPTKERLVINNLVKAIKNIEDLNQHGYGFIYLASGFIAHYNLYGFKDAYYDANALRSAMVNNIHANQWNNFCTRDRDYEYMMQKKRIYNTVLEKVGVDVDAVLKGRDGLWMQKKVYFKTF